MELINFKNWLIESDFTEMATLNFGGARGHAGKDHTETPTHYLQWMKDKINSGEGNFNVTDNGRKLNPQELSALIDKELASRNSGSKPSTPVYSQTPKTAPSTGVQPVVQGMWVWGKAIASRPDLGIPIAGLDLAMKQQDQENWMFVIIDPEEGRLVSRGLIPTNQIKEIVRSQKNENGQLVRANKPSEILQLITPKKEKSGGSTIPDDRITPEQKAIEDRFEKMINSPQQSHMVISALAGSGKAQPLDSLLLTPSGWVKMGEIKKGDQVFGSDGLPHKVIGVFPQGEKEVFKVSFSDRTSVECCGDHLWLTETKRNRDENRFYGKPLFSESTVVSTNYIKDTIKCYGKTNHYIPLVSPLFFNKTETFIDPYVMGILIGDGCFRGRIEFSSVDSEIIESVGKSLPKRLKAKHKGQYDYRICGDIKGVRNPIIQEIKRLGLWNKLSYEKFIPDLFKFNDFNTRVAILQGLMDSDGYGRESTLEFTSSSCQLSEDVKFLVESLGGTATLSIKETTFTYKNEKKKGKPCYRLNIKMPPEISPFRLPRKLESYTPRSKYLPKRNIVSVESIGIKQCQCISVNSHDNLYVTNNCVLTHNTTVLKHLAWKFSKGKKWLYLVFNSKNKEEAKEEFPSNVQVETTNGWAGREVLGKNVEKPTDRIQGFSFSEKSRLLADSPSFKQIMKTLGLPDHEQILGNDPKRLSGSERTVWYALRSINNSFKSEVLRLLGLCKSFAVDPRKQDFVQSIHSVMDKYDFDIDMDEIKEKINKNSPWAMREISDYMGQDFAGRNFKNEMINATNWMLHQVMPHGTEETFTADSGNQKGTQQKLGNKRDFDDDLWFSAIHADELKWPKYDVVLADEVQDFNVAQQIILKKLAENGAKIVAVGDKFQSIYRFRGADSDAFNQLKTNLQDISHDKNIEHQITSNFRSRQAIVDLSNEEGEKFDHVKNLIKGRPFKETPGKIGKGIATKYDMSYDKAFDTLSSEMKDMGEVKQTAFLARTNEPLIHASLKLMKQGIPFVILGKDIANDLIKHVDKITGLFKLGGEARADDLEHSIEDYLQEMNDKHSGKSAMAGKLKELKEVSEAMISSLNQFRDESPEGSVFEYKKWLRSKFGGIDLEDSRSRSEFKKNVENHNPVILTTVHKSKGLQFQRVFILRDDLWPHPRSTREADLEQEKNNRYIGRTRAEDELHILDLDGQPGYKSQEK
jgi:superfamily I DNA/RNA helicase